MVTSPSTITQETPSLLGINTYLPVLMACWEVLYCGWSSWLCVFLACKQRLDIITNFYNLEDCHLYRTEAKEQLLEIMEWKACC